MKLYEQVNNISVYFMKIDNLQNVFADFGLFELVRSTTGFDIFAGKVSKTPELNFAYSYKLHLYIYDVFLLILTGLVERIGYR